jgi:hypothetical protein
MYNNDDNTKYHQDSYDDQHHHISHPYLSIAIELKSALDLRNGIGCRIKLSENLLYIVKVVKIDIYIKTGSYYFSKG